MKKRAKMSKAKWGKEENSSDLKPKKHKKVYKKMKVSARQEAAVEIEQFKFDSMYEDMFESQEE